MDYLNFLKSKDAKQMNKEYKVELAKVKDEKQKPVVEPKSQPRPKPSK